MLDCIGHLCFFCKLFTIAHFSIVSFVSILFVTCYKKHLCINETLLICNHS